jgi:hypothetical protein
MFHPSISLKSATKIQGRVAACFVALIAVAPSMTLGIVV